VERSHIITSGERGKIVYYWDSSLFSKAVSVPSPTGVAEGKTALTCVSDAITQAGTDMLPTDTVTDVPTSAAASGNVERLWPDAGPSPLPKIVNSDPGATPAPKAPGVAIW
jgi:hypothetical protein